MAHDANTTPYGDMQSESGKRAVSLWNAQKALRLAVHLHPALQDDPEFKSAARAVYIDFMEAFQVWSDEI